jgi:hypothetical protein
MSEATQPLFDDPWSTYEYAARRSLNVGDNWKVRSVARAVHPLLEDSLRQLDQDRELSSADKWEKLSVSDGPVAWLPNGWMLVVMYDQENPDDAKTGFVNVDQSQKKAFGGR